MNRNDIERINSFLENSMNSLEGFVGKPEKSLDECLLQLDSFLAFLDKNSFPYLQEKVENVSKILFLAKKYFEKTSHLDIDLLEELLFFINGSFLDLSSHIKEIKEKDLEELKNKYWQKIIFLNNWVMEFLRIPQRASIQEKEQFEKHLLFSIGENQYSIPVDSFKQILLIEDQSEIDEYNNITLKNQKIPLVDRIKALGVYQDKIPKSLILFDHLGKTLAIEIDQVHISQDLNIRDFVPIDLVAGTLYEGPIDYITLFENRPIFIINPKSPSLNPLTG